jgi:hypothetical protein
VIFSAMFRCFHQSYQSVSRTVVKVMSTCGTKYFSYTFSAYSLLFLCKHKAITVTEAAKYAVCNHLQFCTCSMLNLVSLKHQSNRKNNI